MTALKDKILALSQRNSDEVVRLRRHFHMHPELSFAEAETAAYITGWLGSLGVEYREGIAGTGIIASIQGLKKGKKVIAIRAELDALPITETNICHYASLRKGVMHACGHDGHMAMLMGTIMVLKELTEHFGGTVLFIFQPGEEKSPGGARLLIESGALNNPKPDIIIAQHSLPELEAGKIGYKPGRYMASADEIYITVSGLGGHAALPGMSTDQVMIASRLVIRLKDRIAEEQAARNIPTVLGIGRFIAEGATNVIPANVEIAGTFRTFDEQWRRDALNIIGNIASATAEEYGVKIEVTIAPGYPVLHNDETLTGKAIKYTGELLGPGMVETFGLRMSSDDFSFYRDLAPSLYYRVGTGKKDAPVKKLHTSEFDIDETALSTGMANMSWLVTMFLNEDND